MEAIWFARRAALPCLWQQHPEWTNADLAAAVGASESWVKKWLARFKRVTITDPTLYQARSHARQTPRRPRLVPVSNASSLCAMSHPPPLRRVPGPRTLLAFLHHAPKALVLGVPLPRSTRTIWKVLRVHGRIAIEVPHQHRPLEPPAPLAEVQADSPLVAHPRRSRRQAAACLRSLPV
jgi:hypothetical protein